MNTQYSAHDGSRLPDAFVFQPSVPLVDYLNGDSNIRPEPFTKMGWTARKAVVKHLIALGKVSKYSSRVKMFLSETDIEGVSQKLGVGDGRGTSFPLHGAPNGGKRLLPSVYTNLHDVWVRSNGEPIRPEDMSDNHLQNTLNLLKESYKNAVSGVSGTNDISSRHFANCPKVMEAVIALQKAVEEVDVEDVYPIWRPVADELRKRQSKVSLDLDTDSVEELRASFEKFIASLRR